MRMLCETDRTGIETRTYIRVYICTIYKSRRNGDKENLANGMNGKEFDERSKIDYGSRTFDDAAASLHGDKYRNSVNL